MTKKQMLKDVREVIEGRNYDTSILVYKIGRSWKTEYAPTPESRDEKEGYIFRYGSYNSKDEFTLREMEELFNVDWSERWGCLS